MCIRDRYKQYLAPTEKLWTYEYTKAYYLFNQREFEQANDLLVALEQRKDLPLSVLIRAKTLSIRVYYEDWEQKKFPSPKPQEFLLSKIKSFENYIYRSKQMAKPKKQEYLQFIQLLKQMVNCIKPTVFQLKDLMKIKTKLKQNKAIALRFWLQQKNEFMLDYLS